jgi:hypothetical protein
MSPGFRGQVQQQSTAAAAAKTIARQFGSAVHADEGGSLAGCGSSLK